MKIQLVPIAADRDTLINVLNDLIEIDGETVDLSILEPGDEIDAERPIVGPVRRDENGEILIAVEYRYDSATAEPFQSPDPADYLVELSAGAVPCPIKRKPKPDPKPEEADQDAAN